MRCEDVEVDLLELIEGELPPARRSEVLTHLDGCAACTAESSAYHDLLTRVQVDPVPEPSPSFWEEFLPSLQRRIGQEASRREPGPAPATWLTGVGSWLTFRPRFIAGLAVAAVSLFIVVRLPGVLPMRVNRQAVPVSMETLVGQTGAAYTVAVIPRSDRGNQQSGETFVVAGEVVEEPSILMAAIRRLGGVDEIADRLEAAWVLRPEADLVDSLASLNEEERQVLLDHLSHLRMSES